MGRPVTALILFGLFNGGFALKCMVGLNNETKPMECSGSWEKVQADMKTELGDQFEAMKANLTTDLTGTIAMLKEKFGGAIDALKNALPNTDNGRKRRSAELIRARRSPGEGGAAEPEPEGEPEPEEDYYCVKKSMGGKSLKSCLPKAVADPLKMACSMLPGVGDVCVCQDQDLCNGSHVPTGAFSLLATLLLFALFA